MPDPRDLVKALGKIHARRERNRAPVHPARVVGRNEDGTLQLQRTDAECVSRGNVSDAFQGDVILEPRRAPMSRRGLSGVALLAASGSAAVLWVERLDPDTFSPGGEYEVLVFGRGFQENTVFEFLRPNSNLVNDDIAITGRVFVDAENFTLSISVDAGATLYRGRAPLAYDNPGAPL